MFIVWYPHEFSRLYNSHPCYWNSLSHMVYMVIWSYLTSCGEFRHFLQLMSFSVSNFSFHRVPITAGWAEAVWNEKFARHFYTWPAEGIELQTVCSWVQHPIHWVTCFHHMHCLLFWHVVATIANQSIPFQVCLYLVIMYKDSWWCTCFQGLNFWNRTVLVVYDTLK